MANTDGGRDQKGRFIRGNRAALRHCGFTSVAKHIPLRIRRQVQALREQLIMDVAGLEANLTAAQMILIEKTTNLYQITLCLEAYIRREGPFRGKKLDPILSQNYIAYVNSIRLNLRELGLSRRVSDDPFSIAEVIEEYETGPETSQERRSSAGEGQRKGDSA